MSNEIRILSLWQPWASLIALGLKRYETRSWATPYRGKIAIQAAKRPVDSDGIRVWLKAQELAEVMGDPRFHTYLNLPLGCIVAVADLSDCRMMDLKYSTLTENLYAYINEQSDLERAVGDWQPGRYAWKLENIRPIAEPIPCRGAQGLRVIRDEAILAAIEQQLALTDSIEQQLQAIGEAAVNA